MYLTFGDLAQMFKHDRGIQDSGLVFHTVSDCSSALMPRGIFIPLHGESNRLDEAIANGAIAAVWEKGRELPFYTPNHFPVFLAEDLFNALEKLLYMYSEKINGETDKKMNMTKFLFLDKERLNKNKKTYDIAVMLEKLNGQADIGDKGRRE